MFKTVKLMQSNLHKLSRYKHWARCYFTRQRLINVSRFECHVFLIYRLELCILEYIRFLLQHTKNLLNPLFLVSSCEGTVTKQKSSCKKQNAKTVSIDCLHFFYLNVTGILIMD
jgi:hypothetical protein